MERSDCRASSRNYHSGRVARAIKAKINASANGNFCSLFRTGHPTTIFMSWWKCHRSCLSSKTEILYLMRPLFIKIISTLHLHRARTAVNQLGPVCTSYASLLPRTNQNSIGTSPQTSYAVWNIGAFGEVLPAEVHLAFCQKSNSDRSSMPTGATSTRPIGHKITFYSVLP